MDQMVKNNKYKIGFGLALASSIAILVIVSRQAPHIKPSSARDLALERGKLISEKLIQNQFKRTVFSTQSVPNDRTIASISSANPEAVSKQEIILEGQIGRDPWGHPFSYKKIKDKLYMWSRGENQKLDSTIEQIEAGSTQLDDLLILTDVL